MRKPVSNRRQKKAVKNCDEISNVMYLEQNKDNVTSDLAENLRSSNEDYEKNADEGELRVSTGFQGKLELLNANEVVYLEHFTQLQKSYEILNELYINLTNENKKLTEMNETAIQLITSIDSSSKSNFSSLKRMINDKAKLNVEIRQEIINELKVTSDENFRKYCEVMGSELKSLKSEVIEEVKNNFDSLCDNHKVFSENLKSINSNILTHIPFLFKSELSELKNILLGSKKEKDLERTISFQLGKELIDSVKNVKEIISLPLRLRDLREENAKRKKINNAPIVNQLIKPKDNRSIVATTKETLNQSSILNETGVKLSANSYEILKAPLKNKKLKILSVINKTTFESLTRDSDLNYLLEINEKQISGTTSDLFVLESSYSTFKNIWNYATISNNAKHPMTHKLLESLDKVAAKKIPIIFLDRSTLTSAKDFDLIREVSDVVLTCSNQIKGKYSHLRNVIKINDFYNEYNFNPNDFEIKKVGGVAFFGEFNSNVSLLNESFKPYLKELILNNVCVYKGLNVDNPIYDNIGHLKTIDTLNSQVLSKEIKIYDAIFYIADENEDFVSQQLLSYLASSRPIISNGNRFLQSELKQIVTFVDDTSEIEKSINLLKDHRWISQRKAHLGYRYANEKYTSKNFINQLSEIFIDNYQSEQKPLISILMATMREEYSDRIVLNLTRQSYVNKEIIIMTQNWSDNGIQALENTLKQSKKFKNVVVLSDDTDMTLGERLNKCFEYASGACEYVAKMDDDDFYFSNYLSDLVIPFSFGNYAVVGKWEYFIYLEESNKVVLIRDGRGSNRDSDMVAGATLLIKKTVFEKFEGFKPTNNGEDSDLLKRIQESKLKVYSSDPFNLVVFRSKDVSNHTFRVKAEVFEKSCTFICNGIDESIVTV